MFLIIIGVVGAVIATTDAISRMAEDAEAPDPPLVALPSAAPPELVPVPAVVNATTPVLSVSEAPAEAATTLAAALVTAAANASAQLVGSAASLVNGSAVLPEAS